MFNVIRENLCYLGGLQSSIELTKAGKPQKYQVIDLEISSQDKDQMFSIAKKIYKKSSSCFMSFLLAICEKFKWNWAIQLTNYFVFDDLDKIFSEVNNPKDRNEYFTKAYDFVKGTLILHLQCDLLEELRRDNPGLEVVHMEKSLFKEKDPDAPEQNHSQLKMSHIKPKREKKPCKIEMRDPSDIRGIPVEVVELVSGQPINRLVWKSAEQLVKDQNEALLQKGHSPKFQGTLPSSTSESS